jgi:tetratricopeptide (TPR) repeat protein
MERPTRPTGPAIPDDVTGSELDQSIRGDLRTLSLEAATVVSRHLVMAERTLGDNPELAWEHAKAAVSRGGRLAVVREAAGVSAYAAGHYADALAQFRAARRISGSDAYWPVMADCERGLGRPERAITMAGAPEADRLDREGRIELRIVASGARRDLGQIDAALVTLQCPELSSDEVTSWSARIKFAYADTLLEAGRSDEAREWFTKASEVDALDETEAAERLAEMDGLVWVDLVDGEDDEVDVDLVIVEDEDGVTVVVDEEFDEDDDDLEDDELDEDELDEDEDFEDEEDDLEDIVADLSDVESSTISEADALLEKLEAEALALERAAAEAIAAVTAARAALESRAHHESEDSNAD